MQINEITTTIIIVITISIMTSGVSTISSMVFAQNDSEDSETDLNNLTLTNSSEVQVGSSGAELPQQQPQGPLSPPTVSEQQPQGPLPPLQQSPSEQPSEEPTIR
jgi:hypothetical protein